MIQIGDELFGAPVVEVTATKVVIRHASQELLTFDLDQFTSGVLTTLAALGLYVPGA